MHKRKEPIPDKTNQLSAVIVDSALKVHKALGPVMIERVYEQCLIHELTLRSVNVKSQVFMPIDYKGLRMEEALRIDVLVEDLVIIEIKSVEAILPLHEAQLLTYLKLSNNRLGLLINFNSPLIKDGIKRIAN